MSEKPILFNTPMVNAILAGEKTETRRIMKPQPKEAAGDIRFVDGKYKQYLGYPLGHDVPLSPYGRAGGLMWVRETWAALPHFDKIKPRDIPTFAEIIYRQQGENHMISKWRPSIFMPKWCARLWLEITDVRIEPLHEITDVGAIDEGVLQLNGDWVLNNFPDYAKSFREYKALNNPDIAPPLGITPREKFKALWDQINLKRGFGWASNPWVFVVSFKPCKKP